MLRTVLVHCKATRNIAAPEQCYNFIIINCIMIKKGRKTTFMCEEIFYYRFLLFSLVSSTIFDALQDQQRWVNAMLQFSEKIFVFSWKLNFCNFGRILKVNSRIDCDARLDSERFSAFRLETLHKLLLRTCNIVFHMINVMNKLSTN